MDKDPTFGTQHTKWDCVQLPPELEKLIRRHEDIDSYRNMVLPKPPKGYPCLPRRAAEASAEYERMMHRKKDNPMCELFFMAFQEIGGEGGGDRTLAFWEIAGIQRWIKSGQRVFYATPEITEACKNTDAMTSVTGEDIRISHPSFMLVVPESHGWTNIDGDKVSHIVVNVMEEESMVARFGGEYISKMGMPSRKYVLLSLFWNNYAIQNCCLPLEEDGATIGELFHKYSNEHIGSSLDVFLSEEVKKSDTEIGFKIADFVANVLLVMQSYPEYIQTVETRARGLDTKKLKKTIKISTIATTSNLRQQVSHVPPSNAEGTRSGKNIKTHMRRGHWRRQRHSLKWEVDNPDVRVVIMPDGGHAHMRWIRPLIIQGKEETKE